MSFCYPGLSKRVFSKGRNNIWVLGNWLYSTILVFPTIIGHYDKFGYDAVRGKCDYIHDEDLQSSVISAKQFSFGIAFAIPMVLIVVSYFTLCRITRNNSSYLKHNS